MAIHTYFYMYIFFFLQSTYNHTLEARARSKLTSKWYSLMRSWTHLFSCVCFFTLSIPSSLYAMATCCCHFTFFVLYEKQYKTKTHKINELHQFQVHLIALLFDRIYELHELFRFECAWNSSWFWGGLSFSNGLTIKI